jgi:predicted nucleotidyltransferase component of viral defense system
MIDKREILEAASSFSLLPSIVEKDYVLGWILAGISSHEELAEAWVFKGGTCLKKCYFETYRFSERKPSEKNCARSENARAPATFMTW